MPWEVGFRTEGARASAAKCSEPINLYTTIDRLPKPTVVYIHTVSNEGEMGLQVPGSGATMGDLGRTLPDEDAARRWFEELLWPNGERRCPSCGSDDTHECAHATMPYRCRACRRYFSVRTGTVMAGSPLPLLKWAYAIHLDVTSPNGASSMKLHRDLGITQKSAWHMQRRIREAFEAEASPGSRRRGPARSARRSSRGERGRVRAQA